MNDIVKGLLKIYSNRDRDIKEIYPLRRKFQNLIAPNVEGDSKIVDTIIPVGGGIGVRSFEPEEKLSDEIIVYFHGGGWVIGSIEYFTMACYNIATETGRLVLSVDYRLAPEHPFPLGLKDCDDTVRSILNGYVIGEVYPNQLIIMGDSAGGNLASALSLKRRDEGREKIKAQVLFYPATYYDHSPNSPYPSIEECGYDYGLTSKDVEDFFSLYVPVEEDKKNPYAAPLMAQDFSNQPPTLIITSQYDPLRDEGEDYGEKLKVAGNIVEIRRMENAIHGFINFPPIIPVVRDSLDIVKDFLNRI